MRSKTDSHKALPEVSFRREASPTPLARAKPSGKHLGFLRNAATASREVAVASAQLDGGGMVELVEDPRDPTRTTLAVVSRSGDIHFANEVNDRGRILVPPGRDHNILGPVRLPRGTRPYESPAWLAREVGSFLNGIVPISQELQLVFGAFTVLTWIADRLPLSPCLVILGPLQLSRALLEALSMVCRLAVVVGNGTTPAGVLTACSKFGTTLLVADYGLRQDVLRTLGTGTRKSVLALQKSGALSSFGPKVIATMEPTEDLCTLGDSLLVSLDLLIWPDLTKPSDPEVIERADLLRRCLLQLRLDSPDRIQPLAADFPTRLQPQGRDLFRCLGASAAGDRAFCLELAHAVEKSCGVCTQPLPVLQGAVVSALFFLAHQRRYVVARGGYIEVDWLTDFLVGQITDVAKDVLKSWEETITLKPKKVGTILKGLGFPSRQRTGEGYTLLPDEYALERIHRLAKLYDVVDATAYSPDPEPRSTSKWCRTLKLVSTGEIQQYEQQWKPMMERKRRDAQTVSEKRLEELRKNPPRLPYFDSEEHPSQGKKASQGVGK